MTRAKIARLERGPVVGSPPTLEWVAVERLQVDPDYQRAVEGEKSRRIIVGMVRGWDWALCQPLVVSRRLDGSLYVLDGQHRLAGAKERGDIPHLPCVLLSDRDAAGEAATFVALNTQRQRLSQADIFNGMLAAGDDEAKQLAAILAETGWRMQRTSNTQVYKPGDLFCAPMLVKVVRSHGAAVVRNALCALREAYPDTPTTNAATLLRALVQIYARNELADIDPDLFIESLALCDPNGWEDEGKDIRRLNPALSRIDAICAAMLENCRQCAADEARAAA